MIVFTRREQVDAVWLAVSATVVIVMLLADLPRWVWWLGTIVIFVDLGRWIYSWLNRRSDQ